MKISTHLFLFISTTLTLHYASVASAGDDHRITMDVDGVNTDVEYTIYDPPMWLENYDLSTSPSVSTAMWAEAFMTLYYPERFTSFEAWRNVYSSNTLATGVVTQDAYHQWLNDTERITKREAGASLLYTIEFTRGEDRYLTVVYVDSIKLDSSYYTNTPNDTWIQSRQFVFENNSWKSQGTPEAAWDQAFIGFNPYDQMSSIKSNGYASLPERSAINADGTIESKRHADPLLTGFGSEVA